MGPSFVRIARFGKPAQSRYSSPPMPTPITIAHLTDVHLGPIAGFTPAYWNLKRLLGYANWLRNRRDAYRMDVLARIVADLEDKLPTTSRDRRSRQHRPAAGAHQCAGVDREARVAGGRDRHPRQSRHLFAPARGSRHGALVRLHGALRARGRACRCRRAFPFVRMLDEVAIIGVNSAVPTPPLVASGRLGEQQLARLGAMLDRLGRADVFRLVLIHHPPLPGQAKRFRGLEDAARLEAVLSRHGAELVLHGHNHRNMLAWVAAGARAGARGRRALAGARAASQGRGARPLQPLPHCRPARGRSSWSAAV
jgi:hypothetical protein